MDEDRGRKLESEVVRVVERVTRAVYRRNPKLRKLAGVEWEDFCAAVVARLFAKQSRNFLATLAYRESLSEVRHLTRKKRCARVKPITARMSDELAGEGGVLDQVAVREMARCLRHPGTGAMLGREEVRCALAWLAGVV